MDSSYASLYFESDRPRPRRLALPAHHDPERVIDADFAAEPPHHLRDYLRVLGKHRWLAGTCFALTAAVTLLVTTFSARLYTAATRVQVARQAPIRLRLEDSVRRLDDGDAVASPSFLATQIAALESRDLAERVIRGRGLAGNETFLHPGRDAVHPLAAVGDLLKALRPRGWEGAAPAAAPRPADATTVDRELIERYMRWLAVTDVRGTDLVEVSFTTPSPALSAFLAAAHTQAYMEANEEAQRATDAVAKDFLERQLREARKQVERAETALDRFAGEHPQVAANQEQKLVASRVAELSGLLTKTEATRAALESRYEFLTSPDASPLAYFLDQPSIQRLRASLADVRTQQAGLGQRLGPNHPRMLELARLEAELAEQIRTEVDEDVRAVRAHYDAERLREDRLRRKLGQQEELGVEMRSLGARYDVLKGYLESAQALHASLLKQRTETAVNAELVASNVRVIERAEIPLRPSKPKVALDLIVGAAAALLLALGAAFVRDYFDSSVRSDAEVEEILKLPTLATIPNFALAQRTDRKAQGALVPAVVSPERRAVGAARGGGWREELMVLREPRSMVAEAFRAMRTAVLFSVHGPAPTVILVTSGRAGEGKTVSSVNLASTLAESGSRVLLIDADLRYPRCHTLLGVENDRGLTSVLGGHLKIDSAIRVLDAPGLFFLAAGPAPTNPAELLGSARMRQLLGDLRNRFDFVILDTSPVLPVTDAVVLARHADGVVLVVKGHETPREVMRRARDRLVQAGATFLGVILNNVDLRWGDPYLYSYATYAGRTVPIREAAGGR